MDKEDKFRSYGKHFGYPQCCIDAFCVTTYSSASALRRRYTDTFAGFVPCEEHAEQLKVGTITHKDLIKDRKCITQYPYDEVTALFFGEKSGTGQDWTDNHR